jgi:putative DNA primase/helicase
MIDSRIDLPPLPELPMEEPPQGPPQDQPNGKAPAGNGAGHADPGPEQHPDDDDDLAVIKIVAGDLMRLTETAEAALVASGAFVFQRGGAIVQPSLALVMAAAGTKTPSWQIDLVKSAALRANLDAAANYKRWDERKKIWRPANCPTEIAEILLSIGRSNLRPLAGIITAPTLRHDGSVLETPGYDERTGLLFRPGDIEFPPIPDRPTRKQAEAARDLLCDLLAEFAFVSGQRGVDASVAFSGFATALIRRSMASAPLHAISSPSPGSGKSFLVDLVSMVTTGYRAPVAALSGRDEEDEKRLDAHLLVARSILSLDNASHPIGGDRLCQILTQESVSFRPMGYTAIIQAATNITLFATGNNLAFAGDVLRRCILCRIDPEEEHPEQREFKTSPMSAVTARRAEFVVAVLTMLRAYIAAGRPSPSKPLASYEHWCQMVRDPLIWLGFTDPIASMADVETTDGSREDTAELFACWIEQFGEVFISAREAVDIASKRHTDQADRPIGFVYPKINAALAAVAADRSGTISAKQLGYWLRAHVDQIVGGLRLTHKLDKHSKVMTWKIAKSTNSDLRGRAGKSG